MAQKNESRKDIEDIKDLMTAGKLVLGSERLLKNLKNGTSDKIYLVSNAPARLVEDIEYYSKMSGSEVVRLDINNEELGVICRKPFLISVVSTVKQL